MFQSTPNEDSFSEVFDSSPPPTPDEVQVPALQELPEEQAVQLEAWAPQVAVVFPLAHVPEAVQQPPQFEGRHRGALGPQPITGLEKMTMTTPKSARSVWFICPRLAFSRNKKRLRWGWSDDSAHSLIVWCVVDVNRRRGPIRGRSDCLRPDCRETGRLARLSSGFALREVE